MIADGVVGASEESKDHEALRIDSFPFVEQPVMQAARLPS